MVNNFPTRTAGLVVFLSLATLFFGIASPAQVAQARPQAAPAASVSLNVPSQLRIGQDFSFTVTFSNASGETGYGPIVDLILPTNGADGHGNLSLPLDGITFVERDIPRRAGDGGHQNLSRHRHHADDGDRALHV